MAVNFTRSPRSWKSAEKCRYQPKMDGTLLLWGRQRSALPLTHEWQGRCRAGVPVPVSSHYQVAGGFGKPPNTVVLRLSGHYWRARVSAGGKWPGLLTSLGTAGIAGSAESQQDKSKLTTWGWQLDGWGMMCQQSTVEHCFLCSQPVLMGTARSQRCCLVGVMVPLGGGTWQMEVGPGIMKI